MGIGVRSITVINVVTAGILTDIRRYTNILNSVFRVGGKRITDIGCKILMRREVMVKHIGFRFPLYKLVSCRFGVGGHCYDNVGNVAYLFFFFGFALIAAFAAVFGITVIIIIVIVIVFVFGITVLSRSFFLFFLFGLEFFDCFFGMVMQICAAYLVFAAVSVEISGIAFAEKLNAFISFKRAAVTVYLFEDIAVFVCNNRAAYARVPGNSHNGPFPLLCSVYILNVAVFSLRVGGKLAEIHAYASGVCHTFVNDIEGAVLGLTQIKNEIRLL